MNGPFPLIVGGLRDLAGMELPGLELRPELPSAVPIYMKNADGIQCLVGTRFATSAEAQDFARGLEDCCECDGQRLLFKRPFPAITH